MVQKKSRLDWYVTENLTQKFFGRFLKIYGEIEKQYEDQMSSFGYGIL